MSRISPTMAAAAAALVAVGAGYAAGRSLPMRECSSSVGGAVVVAVALGLVALVRGRSPVGRLAGVGLVGYVVAATLTEQFASAWDGRDVLVGVAWLVPPAVGGIVLPRRGEWVVGAGCWLVLFAGTAALTYSAWHTHSGMGLVVVWRD